MSEDRGERWFHEPGWSVLNVTGPDAASFLHNLCTNDIKALGVGDACEVLFTDVKGKVQAHAIVGREDEAAYAVVVTSDAAGELHTHLDRYHIREDLTLSVANDPKVLLVGDVTMFASSHTYFPLPILGSNAGLLLGDAATEIANMLRSPSEITHAEVDEDEFARRRVDVRLPLDRIDVDARNLPQELNRDADLINFNKGCYLGQETVARIDALGHVNQLLIRFRTAASTVRSEDELTSDEKIVGRVTTVAAADGGAIGLAYVRRQQATAGAELVLRDATAKIY